MSCSEAFLLVTALPPAFGGDDGEPQGGESEVAPSDLMQAE